MRFALAKLLASYATILGSLHSKRTPIPIRKNGERLPIVACVKAAETRLLSLGKIKTLGLIFRHETHIFARLLPSYVTILGSHRPKRTLIHLRKNGERLPHSSMYNSSRNSATIIRKFRDQGSKFSNETHRVCLRPMLLYRKSFVVNDSFLTLSVHLVLYLFVLTLHAYHSFSYL